MTIVRKKRKEDAILVNPYIENTLYNIKPEILEPGWTCLSDESLPEYYGDFYVRNGFEIISKGLRTELKRIGYDCLVFRWPGDTDLTNRLTFVFIPKSCRVGVTQICAITKSKMNYLRFAEPYPLIEVHEHRYGLGWRLNHGAIRDTRDVTKYTPFIACSAFDRVSFTKNLPILKFLDPNYRKPVKRPKIKDLKEL